MLQTCKHDTAKLIFQKVLIFLYSNNFFIFYLQIFMLLFAHFCIFLVQYNIHTANT